MQEPQPASLTQDLKIFTGTDLSAVSLVVANAVPLIGVLSLGWSTFAVVVVYWTENVMIGLLNVLKMVVSSPLSDEVDLNMFADATTRERVQTKLKETANQHKAAARVHHGVKLFLIPFFIVHYGMFCFVHGMFLFALLGGEFKAVSPFDFWRDAMERLRTEGLLWAVVVLAVSHLFSFCVNFIYHGEYKRVTAVELMAQPYGRVVVLHVAILLGAFALMALGSPIWLLVILVVGKTVLDLNLHLVERKKNSASRHAAWAAAIEAELAG